MRFPGLFVCLATLSSIIVSSAAVLPKRDTFVMRMMVKQSNDFGHTLGTPVVFDIGPEQYDWEHGGCLKFQMNDLVKSALTNGSGSESIKFENNDEVTDWMVSLEKVDPTCTVGFYVPDPFIIDTPYTQQTGCGVLQNKVDQFGKKVNIPMQFEAQFGLQFCCGHDDCAAMLPSNDRDMAWAKSELPDVVFKDDEHSTVCEDRSQGKHKHKHNKDGPVIKGRSYSITGKMTYASNWINCGGAELESCTLTSYPSLLDTKGTTSTTSSAGSTGHEISTGNELKWFGAAETTAKVTVSDTYTYTKAISKYHTQAVSATEMYQVHCQPGQTCAIAFTPKAIATDMSQCLKDGTSRHWTEYEVVTALSANGIQEAQGQYSVVYKD